MAVEIPERPFSRPPRMQPGWTWVWIAAAVLVLVLVIIGLFYAGTMSWS